MKIVAPDGSAVDDGELGEIVVKGPNVMAGYLHNAEATADDDPRRLAAHRRRRLRRLRRLLLHRRPRQGHDHPRRREHLPARDRGGPLHARRRPRVRRDRRARRGARRGGPRGASHPNPEPNSTATSSAHRRPSAWRRSRCQGGSRSAPSCPRPRPARSASLRCARSSASRRQPPRTGAENANGWLD